ncbi:MAG: hypothetical protein NDP13_06705 [Crenarchaeota archaeon]|nr:hypothetical protein [Thermoproteota archaeon]
MPPVIRNNVSGQPVFLKNIFPKKPIKSVAVIMESIREERELMLKVLIVL